MDGLFKIMGIDPSGRGKDEIAISIIGVLNGQLFLLKSIGLQGGYDSKNLTNIALLAKEYKINRLIIESNFGDGMFSALLTPIIAKIYPCQMDEIRHNTQKERRIIDTLEPVLNQHKLIIGKEVIKEDIDSLKIYPDEIRKEYSLIYQMTHLTKDKGCLSHDDRIDCLAMTTAACLDCLKVDVDRIMQEKEEEEWEKEFSEYFNLPLDNPNWFEI